MAHKALEASSNGRTADFGSAHEGSNPSASASSDPSLTRVTNVRAEVKPLVRPGQLLLVAFGRVSTAHLRDASAALAGILGLEARLGPALERPAYAFNKDRGQYHASSILRRLSGLRPTAGGGPVVGILDGDLFLPDAPYVIADADRDAGAALFSVARLASTDPAALLRRVQVEAVHAAGHLLGLSHCLDFRCAMFLSRDAADSDRKGPGLCGNCRTALGMT